MTALEDARRAAGLDRDRPLTPEEIFGTGSPDEVGRRVAEADAERARRLADTSALTPEAQLQRP